MERAAFFGTRIIPKPNWLRRVEAVVGAAIPLHPNAISALKLVVAVPILCGLQQVGLLPSSPLLVLPLLALYLVLDYLDGVVARQQDKATTFGRIFDRVTDLPLLVPLALLCCQLLPKAPVLLKLGLDLALLVLFCAGRGPVENRVRTTFSCATLTVMLLVSQGWLPLAGHALAVGLLWTNVAFSAFVVLARLDLFQRRFIADALSAGNLLCGVGSIACALTGHLEPCLLLLAGSLACDGLDGAAARRWGSTPWGVYSDDVADGVSYGVAPGVLLACAVGGAAGWVLGSAYALFTIARLVYFTASKSQSDPNTFAGMPSPAGAVMVTCAALLFGEAPALMGLVAGAACVLMVSFDAGFRHLGRLLQQHLRHGPRRRRLVAASALLLVGLLVGSYALGGIAIPAALGLAAVVVFGLRGPALKLAHALRGCRAGSCADRGPQPARPRLCVRLAAGVPTATYPPPRSP